MSCALFAPAKVNLVLEVLGERPDGYHEVRTVLQTVSLADRLTFEPAEALEIVWVGLPLPSGENSVARAAHLLREATGYRGGARIGVKKVIPVASGLGGGSSDAAATLLGLDRLWGLGMGREALLPLAAQLGSDVPFFLYSGTALAQGRGERVSPLSPLKGYWLVLFIPPLASPPEKTRGIYQSLSPAAFTSGEYCQRLVDRLEKGEGLATALLFNTFESIAFDFFPGLDGCAGRFLACGAETVHVAGSGPALYTLTGEESAARAVLERLGDAGLEGYLVQTE